MILYEQLGRYSNQLKFRSISVNEFFIGHTVEFIFSYIIPMLHIYEKTFMCKKTTRNWKHCLQVSDDYFRGMQWSLWGVTRVKMKLFCLMQLSRIDWNKTILNISSDKSSNWYIWGYMQIQNFCWLKVLLLNWIFDLTIKVIIISLDDLETLHSYNALTCLNWYLILWLSYV